MAAKKKASQSETRVDALPGWMSDVMQGICYWVGHRRAYYRHHGLVEGAIVGELANLISANIGRDDQLSCEVQYRDHMPFWTPRLDSNIRLDLLVREKLARGKEKLIAIEVKRGTALESEVLNDILRLTQLKSCDPSISTFVLIVSEAKLPKNSPWIAADEDGTSKITANPRTMTLMAGSKEQACYVKVRRVCKALASLKPKSGHTAILIEVLS